ncbi:hypothetical protein [Solibacillus sp. CAU 1738]|uniref:hypothetical protein n=1 Tax=Solibacillus sp. CAU 1738 TaxID=3140363 RepID=UPI00326014CD
MKKLLVIGLFIFIIILAACSNDKVVEPIYEGRDLKIAVIGEFPTVREKNIQFEEMTFDTWEIIGYNAIFISQEYLSEAANDDNVQKFKESKIPIFFLGTKASYMPFMELNNTVTYEQFAKQVNDNENPIAGLLYKGEEQGYLGWTFSYPVVNSRMITSDKSGKIYSHVFNVIEELNL